MKDPATGSFVEEWKKVLADEAKDIEQVDISVGLSTAALAVKDEKELVRNTILSSHYFLIKYSEPYVMLHARLRSS
jgi:nucleosome binding factor SPN SPT16 subunit